MTRLAYLTLGLLTAACSTGEADLGPAGEGGGSSGYGAGGGTPEATPAGLADQAGVGDVAPTQAATCPIDPVQFVPRHRMASATFAVAAAAAGAWPDVDRSQFDAGEFLTYFSLPSAAGGYGHVGSTDGAGELPVDAFVQTTGAPQPQHLVLVVDTSVSMRNELLLAGGVVEALAGTLPQDGGDRFTLIEWGAHVGSFTPSAAGASGDVHTVAAGDAAGLASAFADYAEGLVDAQLGAGGSLGDAQGAVAEALKLEPVAGHVVLVTDGGVTPDDRTLSAIASWTQLGARVSIVEVRSQASLFGASHHRALLDLLADQGGGITAFVSDATLGDFALEADRLLRAGRVGGDAPGLTGPFLLPSAGAGLVGAPLWLPAERPVHARFNTVGCGDLAAPSAFVAADLPPDPFQSDDSADMRAAALKDVLAVRDVMTEGCDAIADLPVLHTELCTGAEPVGYCRLPQLVVELNAACAP